MRSFLLVGLVGLMLVNVAFSLNKQSDCKCRVPANRRIVGGRNATEGSFPWQVSMSLKILTRLPDALRKLVPDNMKYQFHSCGGSIVNERFILTAGHCVSSFLGINRPSFWEIGFGDNDLVQIFNKKQYKPVKAFHQHPDYTGVFEIKNDVGLVELAEPLEFSENVQPACLDFQAHELYDGTLKISGWGSTEPIYYDPKTKKSTKPAISRFLQETEVTDHSQEDVCKRDQNICLKDDEKQSSGCVGDSGGPLHYTKNGKSGVVGVCSYGTGIEDEDTKLVKICGGNTFAYTRLSTFKSWVETKIGQDYCS